MNKSDLARTLAEKNHISIKNAGMVVDVIFDIMTETLIGGNRIELIGSASE